MDPNAISTNQITPQFTTSTSHGLLKSVINLRINRRAFLIGIILYQVIYFTGFSLLVSLETTLVDSFYFPVFYTVFHVLLMLFYVWRLHDINRSGFWMLIIPVLRIMAFSPYLYSQLSLPRTIVDIIFICFLLYKKGTDGPNDYSEKPKMLSSLF
jgi:uncharacterized membrane protein YhaH (DUF805 family)